MADNESNEVQQFMEMVGSAVVEDTRLKRDMYCETCNTVSLHIARFNGGWEHWDCSTPGCCGVNSYKTE